MRKFAVVLLVIGFAQVSAFGGMISFVPEKPTVDVNAGDSPLVKLDVFLEQVGVASFISFDILFGTDNIGLDIMSFEFDATFAATSVFSSITNDNFGIYPDAIKAGFFSSAPITLGVTGLTRVGSLTVDVTAVAKDYGNYEIIVDGDRDGPRSFVSTGAVNDSLFGVGSINVVPEPATISLLGLASLALIRRRRKA